MDPMNPHKSCGYVANKRDEMTFGYLDNEEVNKLVPDASGSACFYSEDDVAKKMTELDHLFVGMRRSTIDKTEMVRQIIIYSIIAKFDEKNNLRLAVYQRAAGAEAKLQGGYSFGFGGHVEVQDLRLHAVETDVSEMTPVAGAISSFISTLASGYREVDEEVVVKIGEPITRPMNHEKLGKKVMAQFGLTEVKVVMGEIEVDELKESAVFLCDKFLITVDENNPQVGCLVHKDHISMEEIYEAIFQEQALETDKATFPLAPAAVGFLSDKKPEQPGWIGNTHFCVIGLEVVPSDAEFAVTEEKYTTIGWLTREEILDQADKFEPWSMILTNHMAEIEELARLHI